MAQKISPESKDPKEESKYYHFLEELLMLFPPPSIIIEAFLRVSLGARSRLICVDIGTGRGLIIEQSPIVHEHLGLLIPTLSGSQVFRPLFRVHWGVLILSLGLVYRLQVPRHGLLLFRP